MPSKFHQHPKTARISFFKVTYQSSGVECTTNFAALCVGDIEEFWEKYYSDSPLISVRIAGSANLIKETVE